MKSLALGFYPGVEMRTKEPPRVDCMAQMAIRRLGNALGRGTIGGIIYPRGPGACLPLR
ncbi:hypothetical protein [Gracilimonas amylolytica]|uniref:hypothetical protein n=1 Tax=Gracilimonas amylolytica TaxID=1749045 RepID=UPI0012FFF837|nr:hypothetical protein [Gracilimonas amylolytica]